MELKKQGIDLFIDDTAVIKRPHILSVGDHVAIDVGVYLSTETELGDYVHIAPYTVVIGGEGAKLIMGHFSGISAGCKIICGSDDFTEGLMNPQVPLEYKSVKFTTVTLEDFTCVGVNSVVMPGVTMAIGSVVGAGSVLTKDTEPWTIYVGTPAKPVKLRDKTKILENAKKLGYKL